MATSDYTSEIPYGYCHCGCGQKTTIANKTSKTYGRIKGQPNKYIVSHKGSVDPNKPITIDRINQFWSRVNKDGSIPAHCPELGQCWEWVAGKSDGYGTFTVNRVQILAHRLSWKLTFGGLLDDIYVLHKCDNPSCVRPEHLFLGNHQDNMDDMANKGRRKQHPFSTGKNNPSYKLSDEQIKEIIKRYTESNITQKELAIEYGISDSYVSMLFTGKRIRMKQ